MGADSIKGHIFPRSALCLGLLAQVLAGEIAWGWDKWDMGTQTGDALFHWTLVASFNLHSSSVGWAFPSPVYG